MTAARRHGRNSADDLPRSRMSAHMLADLDIKTLTVTLTVVTLAVTLLLALAALCKLSMVAI